MFVLIYLEDINAATIELNLTTSLLLIFSDKHFGKKYMYIIFHLFEDIQIQLALIVFL